MTTRRTYPLWNGGEWTFEEIVEDLTGLVKHILLLTTPQEQIQDAMQEVWLKLLERLQVNPELLRDAPGLNNPGYTVSLYYPKPHHFHAWLHEVDEHLLDMTGYSVHQFATIPTFGSWSEWPDDAYEAALAVLRQDAWGQAFLGDLDLE